MLDVKTAELYKEYGIDYLFKLKDKIDWNNSDDWTTAYLLQSMEDIAHNITEWSQHIEEYVSNKNK